MILQHLKKLKEISKNLKCINNQTNLYKQNLLINKMKKDNTTYANKGDKVKVEKCPHCNSELVVKLDKGESEVLECDNCKFVVKKK
jgi:predicted Zn-ribbon and HTH transcriptional regulator